MLTDLRPVEESKRMLIKAKTAKAAANAKLTISTLEMMLSSTIAGESSHSKPTNGDLTLIHPRRRHHNRHQPHLAHPDPPGHPRSC